MSNFFLIPSNLIICKRNNAKMILLIIFFLVSNSNFTKERIYEHIWTYFIYIIYIYIYNYIRLNMFIYIYIYSYMKNFLPGTFTIIYLFVCKFCFVFTVSLDIFCFKFLSM